jgi:hypothetical protein
MTTYHAEVDFEDVSFAPLAHLSSMFVTYGAYSSDTRPMLVPMCCMCTGDVLDEGKRWPNGAVACKGCT